MCLAFPGRIISIDGETAIVDYDCIRRKANVSLIDCKVGDYVLVHVGFAIQRIDQKIAKEAYRLLNENGRNK